MLDDLKELIAIESVMGLPEPGAPFGKGPRAALDWFLNKAASYGLRVGQEDGYCGWAEYGDENKPLMGILGHLDVVPAGDGWSNPPYSLVNRDGYLYGRGVADDKGPTVVALHVLKALSDNGVKLRHRVRVIAGCNEENGSACIKHYAAHCEIPDFNFVPDADFPVINSEKGIAQLSVTLPADDFFSANLTCLESGTRPNVVPDLCRASVPAGSPLYEALHDLSARQGADRLFYAPVILAALVGDGWRPEDFSAHAYPDRIELVARGIAGHAMAPDKGENAFWKLVTLLYALKGDADSPLLERLKRFVCTPDAAERLGVAVSDDRSGALTINCGIAAFDGSALTLTLDLRLPVSADIDDVRLRLTKTLAAGGKLTTLHWSPNLFVDEDSPLIRTLLETYTEQTGEKPYCVKCGGGTYARELPNSVAFGPTFPGAETNIHNADERLRTEQFFKLFDLYYAAVIKLDERMKPAQKR